MNGVHLLFLSILLAVLSCKQLSTTPAINEGSKIKRATDTIPYLNLNGNNWLIVECVVNGKSARLIIDNGTSAGLYLNKRFALENQLIPKDSARADVINLANVNVFAGGINEKIRQCTVFDLSFVTGNVVDGLIGIAFLENYFLEVNYKKEYVIFHKRGSFKVSEKWVALKMGKASKGTGRLSSMEVYLPNGGKIVETGKLDLGLGGTSMFFPGATVRKYHLTRLLKGNKVKDLGRFVSKERVQGYVCRLDSVRINDVIFKSVFSEFASSQTGQSGSGPILFGNGLLKALGNVIFDFKSDVLYFPGRGCSD